MKNSKLGAWMGAMIGAGILQPEQFISKPRIVKKKECLQCGNEHEHNNSFCSAQCCKDFKKPEMILCIDVK